MFSFKNGILNIKIGRPGLDTAVDISFFLLLCSLYIKDSTAKGSNYFYYLAFFLFLGVTLVKLMMRMRTEETIILPSFSIWYGSFLVLSLTSMLWATYPANSMLVISRIVQSLVVTFCIAQHYATRSGLMRCIRVLACAGAFVTLYCFIKTPYSEWFSGEFGAAVTKLNANTIGMIFTVSILISFYLAFYCKSKIYWVATALQLFAIILTSSRKSALASVFGIVMLIIMRSKKRTLIWRILLAVGLAAIIYFIIMTVPELYASIGVRFDSMFDHFSNNSNDYSISLRQSFIENAQDMFFEKPLLGYGINNFIVQMSFRNGVANYAHNNYYEILADLGIIGFVLFYSYYFYLLYKLVKICKNTNGSLAKLMLTMLVVIMICEYGLVTYYSVYIHVFICCCYLFLCAYSQQNDHTNGTPHYLRYARNIYD